MLTAFTGGRKYPKDDAFFGWYENVVSHPPPIPIPDFCLSAMRGRTRNKQASYFFQYIVYSCTKCNAAIVAVVVDKKMACTLVNATRNERFRF